MRVIVELHIIGLCCGWGMLSLGIHFVYNKSKLVSVRTVDRRNYPHFKATRYITTWIMDWVRVVWALQSWNTQQDVPISKRSKDDNLSQQPSSPNSLTSTLSGLRSFTNTLCLWWKLFLFKCIDFIKIKTSLTFSWTYILMRCILISKVRRQFKIFRNKFEISWTFLDSESKNDT